jgi:lipopolysaccharide transport system permease protein
VTTEEQKKSHTSKIITPYPHSIRQYLTEMNKYKSLIWVFTIQEIKSLYAQTYLGVLWSLFRPLITLSIFTIIFNYFLKVPTAKPYYIFAFTGMLAWNFFSQIVNTVSNSIISRQNLIRKIYFPKLILPISKILVASVDFAVSLIIIFTMMIYEQNLFGWHTLSLPIFIVLNIICGLSISLWMNVLNIRFRDLNQIVPAIIGIAIWITPVFYPTTIIPSGYEVFLYLNPMAGVIKGYRFALLGEEFPEWQYGISIAICTIIALWGAWYIKQKEDEMVDFA